MIHEKSGVSPDDFMPLCRPCHVKYDGISPETLAKRSLALKGKPSPWRGKVGPNAGRIFSEEARANMSKAHLGKKASEETRAKMSEAHCGKKRAPRLVTTEDGENDEDQS